jgi:hypothetical protein
VHRAGQPKIAKIIKFAFKGSKKNNHSIRDEYLSFFCESDRWPDKQYPDQVSFQNNTIEFIPRASGQKLVSTW